MLKEPAYPYVKTMGGIKRSGGTKQDAEKVLGPIDQAVWDNIYPPTKPKRNSLAYNFPLPEEGR